MMKMLSVRTIGPLLAFLVVQGSSRAWDYEGHRLINQLALATLPTNFPAFVRTPDARERVAFLSGEPDRWRNTADLPLKHRSEEHTSELQSHHDLVCRLLLEKKKKTRQDPQRARDVCERSHVMERV